MNRLTAPIAVIVVIATAAAFYLSRSQSTTAPIQYKLATVDVGNVEKTVSATGTLKPWSTVDIKSKAGGRVDDLTVDVGSPVKKGQVIARINQADTLLTVQTAKANIDQAQAKTVESRQNYQLQLAETKTNIESALAALKAAQASQSSQLASLEQSRAQAKAQPAITTASIKVAESNLIQAQQQLEALKVTNQQDLASALSTYDQAKANEVNGKLTLERQQKLADKGFVAQQTVDSDEASYDVYKAALHSAKTKLDTIEAQQKSNITEYEAKIESAKHSLSSANASSVDVTSKESAAKASEASYRQAVELTKEAKASYDQALAKTISNDVAAQDILVNKANINANQATLTNANETLKETTVTAPSDGVVIEKDVSEGTYITSGSATSGTTMLTVGEVNRMYVNAAVDESDLSGVSEGQKVSCEFDAYPGHVFVGRVARIDPESPVTNNVTQFDVRVEIDNKAPEFKLLKPGMNSTCTFISAQKTNVLNIESDAISMDDKGNQTVTVATGGKVAPADPQTKMPVDPNVYIGIKIEKRIVATGLVGDDSTEITNGLQAGDKIVVSTIAPVTADGSAPGAPSQKSNTPFGGRPNFPKPRTR